MIKILKVIISTKDGRCKNKVYSIAYDSNKDKAIKRLFDLFGYKSIEDFERFEII